MEENRKYYPHLLYTAMILFTCVLASLGILGYLHYGNGIQQVIIWNIENSSVLPYIVNSVICVGVLFTFPLQNFPVIEIFEELLFAHGKFNNPWELPADWSKGICYHLLSQSQKVYHVKFVMQLFQSLILIGLSRTLGNYTPKSKSGRKKREKSSKIRKTNEKLQQCSLQMAKQLWVFER